MSNAYERALLLMSCLAPQSDQHCLIHKGADTPPQLISQEGTQQSGPFSVLDDKADFDNCLLFGLFHVPAKDTMPDMLTVKGCLQLQDLKVRPLAVLRKMVAKILEPANSRVVCGPISNVCDATPEWVQEFSPAPTVSGLDSAVLNMGFLSPTVGSYDDTLYPWFVLLFKHLHWLRHMLLVQIQIRDASIERVKVGMERYYPEKEDRQESYEEAIDDIYRLMFQGTIDKYRAACESYAVPQLLRVVSLYSLRLSILGSVRLATAVPEHSDVGLLRNDIPSDRFSYIAGQMSEVVNKGSNNPEVQYVFDMIKNRAALLGGMCKE